jgi:hypothetical protein
LKDGFQLKAYSIPFLRGLYQGKERIEGLGLVAKGFLSLFSQKEFIVRIVVNQ